MASRDRRFIRACSRAQLKEASHVVVRGADRPVVVFANDGDARAAGAAGDQNWNIGS